MTEAAAGGAINRSTEDRYQVGSVARALRLIELLAAGPADGLTVSELARGLEVSKSTAFSIARTLVGAGYLRDVEPGPRYQLGLALVRLGDLAGSRVPVGQLCQEILSRLSRGTGLTSRAAVSERGYPVFVERVDAPGAIRFHTPLGVRELPHASSAGKAILSQLSDDEVARIAVESGLPRRTRKTITTLDELRADLAITRRRGFAVDDEEDSEGVFCVGAPFFDHAGNCAGAISATGIKVDLSARALEELGATVAAAAAEVTAQLGGKPRITD